MAKFAITWSLGRVEEVIQEAATNLEEFLNIHFGSAWADAQAAGVTVEHLAGEFLGEAPEPTAEAVAKAEADKLAAEAEADKLAAEAATAAKAEADKLAAEQAAQNPTP